MDPIPPLLEHLFSYQAALCVSTGVVDFERSEVRYDVFAVG
jgi:hypothetical protein